MDRGDNLRFRDELCLLKRILFSMSPWRRDHRFNHDPSTPDNDHTHYAAYYDYGSNYDNWNDFTHFRT